MRYIYILFRTGFMTGVIFWDPFLRGGGSDGEGPGPFFSHENIDNNSVLGTNISP